jgi:prepilin-type N-terminal cleavage/methylation domain-containing protein
MKTKIKNNYPCRAFTMVEILMVLVVISILIGLLVPALSSVKKMAANVRQKAQFTTIGMGLEAYNNDFGEYPDSDQSSGAVPTTAVKYNGAQKLAEAMVGLDGYGFHKDSIFGHDGLDGVGNKLYDNDPANPMVAADLTTSVGQRKGPYLELEAANAVPLKNLYSGGSGLLTYNSFVLSDKFGLLKNAANGKKTGKPILYFRANTNETLLSSVYKVFDNIQIVGLDGSFCPEFAANPPLCFEDRIANPNFTFPVRPYRSESYILLSAGADGMYFSPDDVYNFDVEK